MSRFHGPQGKGAMRKRRAEKREEAEARQKESLTDWVERTDDEADAWLDAMADALWDLLTQERGEQA